MCGSTTCCGWQAASQIACIRAAVTGIERVTVYCRNAERLAEFCREHGCEPAETHRDAADADIVLFKSNGITAWDLAAGARVVELARAR